MNSRIQLTKNDIIHRIIPNAKKRINKQKNQSIGSLKKKKKKSKEHKQHTHSQDSQSDRYWNQQWRAERWC